MPTVGNLTSSLKSAVSAAEAAFSASSRDDCAADLYGKVRVINNMIRDVMWRSDIAERLKKKPGCYGEDAIANELHGRLKFLKNFCQRSSAESSS